MKQYGYMGNKKPKKVQLNLTKKSAYLRNGKPTGLRKKGIFGSAQKSNMKKRMELN